MIVLHPWMVLAPTPSDAESWAALLSQFPLIDESGDMVAFSGDALAAAYGTNTIATRETLRLVVDSLGIDPMGLATLVEAILQRAVYVESLPIAADVRLWDIKPQFVADSAGPCAPWVPLLVLAASDSKSKIVGGRVCATGVLHIQDGERILGDVVVDMVGTVIRFELVDCARAWFAGGDAGSGLTARIGLLVAFADSCDDRCFVLHSGMGAIHREFESSEGYARGSADLRRVALRKAATWIHSGFKENTRPLRVSAAGGSPPCRSRRRDAEGRRAHVTKRGAGYRLHAWLEPSGSVELASLAPKSYTAIPD